MKEQKRLRDYGIVTGKMPTGMLNAITDVPGIKVGHATINTDLAKTGVTAILPHEGNMFQEKVMAACHVINGFGKSIGLVQIEELGTIETPIVLTNTLSVGTVSTALIEYMLKDNPDIGVTTGTINPVVGECNDSFLNDIRGLHVKKEHVEQALSEAASEFYEGSIGAGTGMSCYGLKGGIGSSSRVLTIDDEQYTIGVLVLANFGMKEDLTIDGQKVGRHIIELEQKNEITKEMGSIIVIVATDLPVTERQLKRFAKRAAVGISKTGSFIGNGSGDIVVAFSTANRIGHYPTNGFNTIKALHEEHINAAFRAVAEATEESILNALVCAETTTGRDGHVRHALKEYKDIFTND